MPLTESQLAIIKATIPVLEAHGLTITKTFYKNILNDNPSLRCVFSHSHQQTGHQAGALAGALHAYASNIDNLAALGPAVELICGKHASLYIQPEHYDVVGTYLLAAMGEVLGDALTPEILDAWKDAYFQLAHIMIEKEKSLYASMAGWTDWKKMQIVRKVQETPDITSFYMQFPSSETQTLPSWKPGQYISIRVHVDGLGFLQPRQYSLSDAPGKGHFRISVKRETEAAPGHPAYVSNLLHDRFQEGDEIEVSHPMGDFFLEPTKPAAASGCPFHNVQRASATTAEQTQTDTAAESKEDDSSPPLILIAAGVGVTPLMSILTSQTHSSTASSTKQRKPITFIHSSCNPAHRPFQATISALQKEAAGTTDLYTIYFNSRSEEGATTIRKDTPMQSGKSSPQLEAQQEPQSPPSESYPSRIDLDKIRPVLEEQRGLLDPRVQVYVCGPPDFMRDVRAKLVQEWGVVPAERVHVELFGTGGV